MFSIPVSRLVKTLMVATIPALMVATISLQPAAASSGIVDTAGMSAFQRCVISRESGGNPAAVNPVSGAGGLYQFLPSTWAALGFPGRPQDTSVAVQNTAFAKAYAWWGTSPWAPYDGC